MKLLTMEPVYDGARVPVFRVYTWNLAESTSRVLNVAEFLGVFGEFHEIPEAQAKAQAEGYILNEGDGVFAVRH